ncbi:hypothetical protein A8B82_05650 [Sulfitobacter sp. EhC04]|nr:hypothetical protein A8B82_05650 [Sulfitobacter sp. EhC04]
MQERSIDNALLALRKLTIRERREGLAQVEALLALRGVHMPAVLPAKRGDVAKRGHMSLMIMGALRDGPKPLPDIVAVVAARRPELPYDVAYKRTGQALANMKHRGQVVREVKFWRIIGGSS